MTKTTKVVNVKVANLRPSYNNLQEWCQDCNNIYIGRRGVVFIDGIRFPHESSIWANPFKISKDLPREECLVQYEKYIRNKITQDSLAFDLLKLKGKTLGCWCKPSECHGDILLNLIDEFAKK
jgi:hypothetical protein